MLVSGRFGSRLNLLGLMVSLCHGDGLIDPQRFAWGLHAQDVGAGRELPGGLVPAPSTAREIVCNLVRVGKVLSNAKLEETHARAHF